jgi:hypothetical protein
MRVCQFRHYGTVSFAPPYRPEHANRESLVLQTLLLLSMYDASANTMLGREYVRQGALEHQKTEQ